MIKTLIVEDDALASDLLHALLQKYCTADIVVAGQARNVTEAFELIQLLEPELVFLDVELGSQTAFDLLSRFSFIPFKIVFISAFNQYALNAIKFSVLDYILKPIEISELVNAVAKVRQTLHVQQQAKVQALFDFLQKPAAVQQNIAIPTASGYHMIAIADILYCEANKEYTGFLLLQSPLMLASYNIGYYESVLPVNIFFRVHHSYMVNRQHIQRYIRGEGGELIMRNGLSVPVSRRKKQEFIEWLTQ
jgi:two-component system, LytTR family, response regulator